MKRKGKYLKFYEKCLANRGKMFEAGLCGNLGYYNHNLDLFIPVCGSRYNYYLNDHKGRYTFNDLRQNVVLFLACMNNEL